MKPSHVHIGKRWLALLLVACLHVGGLAAVMMQLDKPAAVVTPPAMVGMLVAPPSSVQPPLPLQAPPEQHKPRPVQKPRPTPAPQPPAPTAPPSERAITAAPPADPAPARDASTSVAQATPNAAAAAAEPAPGPTAVTPPYASAAHLNNPAPVYPATSRRLGEQGRVLIEAYILPDGTVGEIRLKRSCGHARLDDSALQAVKHWRFVPARRGNETIAYWYVLPITFELSA